MSKATMFGLDLNFSVETCPNEKNKATLDILQGIYITFEDGDDESQDLGPLGPHAGYHWIRLDPCMKPRYEEKPFSGFVRF